MIPTRSTFQAFPRLSHRRFPWLALVVIPWAVVFLGLVSVAHAIDHSHALLSRVFKTHVNAEGMVDYSALKKQPEALGQWLAEAAAVTQGEYTAWSRDQKLAFLINVYNAATVKLIVDHYPVASIKKIGGFSSPWKLKVVHLWGSVVSLDHVEHELIRAVFNEPRIHFALVCAAMGCPPLRAEAFQAVQLDRQLTDQGRRFLAQKSKNWADSDKKVLHLSKIFDWYGKDFSSEGEAGLPLALKPYWPANGRPSESVTQWSIQYLEYDWSLNEKK